MSTKESKEKVSKKTQCKELLNEFSYKKTTLGIFGLINTVDGKSELPLQSKTFKNHIMNEFLEKYHDYISSATISEVVNAYEGYLNKTLKTKKTVNRIKMFDDKVLVAKGNEDFYEITSRGWEEKTGGEEYFSRHAIQGIIPVPKKEGNLDLIFKYCRIPEELKLIFMVYIVSCFLDIIKPGLVLYGEAGSSKSSVSKMLKLLIDPCNNSLPFQFPKNEDDLKQIYYSNYFAAFDNMDKLSNSQSDFICSVITGVEIQKRKLFTDSEDYVFTLRNPIVLNGISNVVKRSDLVDRCIMVKLPFISEHERLPERKMFKDFQNDLPLILGGVFNSISLMLGMYEEDSVCNLPRLADFAEYGFYIAETFGKGNGEEFLDGYKTLVKRQKRELIKDDFLSDVLIRFIQRKDNNNIWVGNMTELYNELENIVDLVSDNKWMRKDFPKSPQHLSRSLSMIIPPLKQNGIYVNITRDSKNVSEVHLFNFNGLDKNVERIPVLTLE